MNAALGLDGCRGGWVAAHLEPDGTCHVRIHPALRDLLRDEASTTAIDIPLGLLDAPAPGGRTCDREARRRLGPRRASVFSPPPRPALQARRYDDVRRLGVSLQAYHLLPRMREADALLTPALQERVREAHPELAFARLLGHPAHASKKRPEGRAERLAALDASGAFREPAQALLDRALDAWPRRVLQPDDVLDALAIALTASRIADGTAERVPADPPRDARGLRMEILY